LNVSQGRMKKKMMGAVEAIDGGVNRIVFADARLENCVEDALNGGGTVIE
jgi:[amino group carrier protein]-L-2-aminoadipate 6-kinase